MRCLWRFILSLGMILSVMVSSVDFVSASSAVASGSGVLAKSESCTTKTLDGGKVLRHFLNVRSASSTTAIAVVAQHLSVSPGEYAYVTIRTSPGAKGTIEVDYKTGPSHAQGLEPKTADASGKITWRWRVGTHTSQGNWRVVIRVGAQYATLTLSVHCALRI